MTVNKRKNNNNLDKKILNKSLNKASKDLFKNIIKHMGYVG